MDNTSGLKRQDFLQDGVLLKAVIRRLEIIGEATKNVPEEIRVKYPTILWREMAGTRDKLIHHYFGIDYEILWDIIENEIPVLKLSIEELIKSEGI